MSTFVINLPDNAAVIFDEKCHRLTVGVTSASAAHPYADRVSIFCCPGTPMEDKDAVSAVSLSAKRNGLMEIENIAV